MEFTNDVMYLPDMYTHQHGYKICLQVHPNGFGDGKGTHVSIFTCLRKGIFDEQLRWPYKDIQIVNQARDHDHVEKVIDYSDKTPVGCASKVISEERSEGWGFHTSLSHSDLQYKASKGIQYLKDNYLMIRVVKVKKS